MGDFKSSMVFGLIDSAALVSASLEFRVFWSILALSVIWEMSWFGMGFQTFLPAEDDDTVANFKVPVALKVKKSNIVHY